MEKLKLLIIFVMILIVSCKTTPEIAPIIINDQPTIDLSDDIELKEFLYKTSKFSVKLKAFIDELINQIINKAPYIDNRKEKQ